MKSFKRTKTTHPNVQVMKHDGWVDAEPNHTLTCEHYGCNNVVHRKDQYVRINRNLPHGWGNRPEFLCPAHAKGRKRIGFYERVIEPKILKWLSCFK